MTAAARLARSLRHRLGDTLIDWGARLTHDVEVPLTDEQSRRIERVIAVARAVIDAEDAARAHLRGGAGLGETKSRYT